MTRLLLVGWILLVAVAFQSSVFANAMGPFGQIMRGEDPKHVPVIDAPEAVEKGVPFQVTITIGKTLHPSQPDHHIQWVELYAGEVQLARASFTPTLALPVVTFTIAIDAPTTLRALSQPNHSAAWEATKKVNIKPEKEK